jgi:coenzyme PQQ synthesis protein D (PqqD)
MDRFQIKSPQVIHETIDGEVVIVNLESGTYYSLTGSGERIWAAIARGESVNDILTGLRAGDEGIGHHLEATASSFLEELEQEGLITRAHDDARESPRAGASTPAVSAGAAFEAPVLQKFQDLKELILLDPVHEIQEDVGWPQPKTAR